MYHDRKTNELKINYKAKEDVTQWDTFLYDLIKAGKTKKLLNHSNCEKSLGTAQSWNYPEI